MKNEQQQRKSSCIMLLSSFKAPEMIRVIFCSFTLVQSSDGKKDGMLALSVIDSRSFFLLIS